MDLSSSPSIQHQDTTESSSQQHQERSQEHPEQELQTQEASLSSFSTATASTAGESSRTLRSSARVKAAKQKEKEKAKEPTVDPLPTTSSSEPSTSRSTRGAKSKRPREQSSKGKGKESADESNRPNKKARRATFPATTSALTINEPPRDIKGKKRAAPEPNSDEDESTAAASSSAPIKRQRATSAYALRSRTDITTEPQSVEMPKKPRTSTTKGRLAGKSKAMATASSSRVEDEDVDMMEAECKRPEEDVDHDEHAEEDHDEDEHMEPNEKQDEGGGDDDDGGDDDGGPPSGGGARESSGFDDSAAMAIFSDFRGLGSYMMGLSTRLKTMLNNIKMTADPTTRLVTLQELSELLSISTEDTLAGSFQVEAFVRELVKILGGTGNDDGDDDDGDGNEGGETDDDAALAAALAMSTGGTATFQGDENLEAQVLACRCLANLMEALPGVAHTVVYHGAIPVLCSKLIEISYIDLAEQTLSTLEKVSEEFPSSIVREGGLAALLNYLDFFSIAVQRTALQAASNCCRNISAEHFPMIHGVWPIIRNCLAYSDQRLVEFACLCVIRVVESYYRSYPEHLEALVDTDLIKAVNLLLLPAGGSPLIAPNTFTLLLRALATSARASPKITIALLEADIVDTLYQILTGVLPSSHQSEEQGDSASGQGLGGGLADMTVMENLAHRPKDQVEEALSLVSELMPPLPKDGVFDHKSYTEKALARMAKAKAKADRAAARQAAAIAHGINAAPSTSVSAAPSAPTTPAPEDSQAVESGATDTQAADVDDPLPPAPVKEPTPDRTEMLRSKPEIVGRFMELIVPILIDIYAASVSASLRIKTLTGLLKAVTFLDEPELRRVMTSVPVASFASSILSSKDHPTLVIGALQLVEMLLNKLPGDYKPAFRREGVFHEVEAIASRNLAPPVKSKEKDKEKDKDKDGQMSDAPSPAESALPPPPLPIPAALAASIPGYKKLSSLSLDPEDAITLRSRVIRFKHLSANVDEDGDNALTVLRRLVSRISTQDGTEAEYASGLRELADLFASMNTSVSSFELLQSGVVDGLLDFATKEDHVVDIHRRRDILYDAFSMLKVRSVNQAQSPLSVLVKKLQESLTRMESFEVATVSQGIDDSKRSSPSLLARQLRLRLVAAEDSDIPRSLNNIVVSIHAIATFQALHDYLRPRVSGVVGGSRLSGMLAALAASGLAPGLAARTLASGQLPSLAAPPAPTPAESSSNPASSANQAEGGVARRRSLRLSKKNGTSAPEAAILDQASASASTSAAQPEAAPSEPPVSHTSATAASSAGEPAPSETLVNEEDEHAADFSDEEVDAEIFDEDMDPDSSVSEEKTVTLSVADDGSKIEAQTPDGTRVATPNPLRDSSSVPTPRGGLSSKGSYAAALKAKPTDWHLEFSMDDHVLPLDLTIYGGIHQHEMRKKSGPSLPPSLIWQGIYTVKFKKVPGPAPAAENRGDGDIGARSRSPAPSFSSLPETAPHTKILRLLRVLHQLNVSESERSPYLGTRRNLPESAFVNNKLTAKLTRQLEEPMIVASSCLPDWALDLPLHFPFLFPFATRYNFLQSTSFGYARLILKWQTQQNRGQDSSRRDDSIAFLGRLQRQKVRISRKHILESAVKVFELYGSSSSILEVEYFEEVGTGLGPTLEFYSLVCKEFARKDLKIWRDEDPTHTGSYVSHPHGLFPAPISPQDIANDGEQKRTHIFRVIGQFVAKAMLDSRIIDLSFNKIFIKLVLGDSIPLTIESLKLVDLELANSLVKLRGLSAIECRDEKLRRKIAALEETVSVEDLALDFTLPGYEIELRPGGADIAVTADNVEEYIQEVVDAIIGKGVQPQAKAFREGFSKVFPISDLQAFSADELVMLFGNSDEDWSIETLSEALKADHGFNVESRAIRDLVEIMSEFEPPSRRDYLQFITGSPKLPIGGFRGLNPPLTVVRKPHEAPLTADDYLPSVMTCVNYLKLPEYSNKAVMREKLRVAMKEGVGSFHLS
ncbi:hypothetical protein JAAARDRAFT_30788 [Jaapia argillacea MUCL 33604]|uniref:HECT-type E3 ubiquitin transferase n=1 Tax=Jaapia argillacea MUCL 33604 TaxID=933084 RepID=A0A067QCX3_9AGAM|nr:hypothetical protein JAAARDRAFT_30788 [Jaapia argillacea MUCL 33604]